MKERSARDRGASKVALSICAMLAPDHPLLLASGSPRRRELLQRIGVPLLVHPVDVDERVPAGMGAAAYLRHVVGAKQLAAQAALAEQTSLAQCPALLVADTVVVVADSILGKPDDDADAQRMIAQLAGTSHQVMTRFAVALRDGAVEAATVTTEVTFRTLDRSEIDAYVGCGEGRDKAGAYGIQGVGAALVEGISGCYSNVVGLPLSRVAVVLQQLGLWRLGAA